MSTMGELFEALDAEVLIESADLLAFILEADAALLDALFEAEDAAQLDRLGDLLLACAAGALLEEQVLAMEGVLSFLKNVKKRVAKRLPPGTKMVFGKVVKVGRAAGQAAKATARGVGAGARGLVRAKRAVQAAGYGFTKAGKAAKAAAQKVAAAKGRAAGKAAYQAAKGTYKSAVKAGEAHAYAAGQAQRATQKAGGRAKAAQYGPSAPAKKAKAKPPVKKSAKPPAKKPKKENWKSVPGTGHEYIPMKKKKPIVAGMDTVFDLVEANLSSRDTDGGQTWEA